MTVVAGVDFGTLSVRVRSWTANAGCSRPQSRNIRCIASEKTRIRDPIARRPHGALAAATREAVKNAGVRGDQVEAIAVDTTGSSVIPVGKDLQPLGEYYLWCDHRAKGEAAEITEAAHRE